MSAVYFIDAAVGDERVGRDGLYGTPVEDMYALVIRRSGKPGWVFRFKPIDSRGAHETLANLNWGYRAAA